jgi:hypothetical protein
MLYSECVIAKKTYEKMSFIKAYTYLTYFLEKALANSESKVRNHMKLILCSQFYVGGPRSSQEAMRSGTINYYLKQQLKMYFYKTPHSYCVPL